MNTAKLIVAVAIGMAAFFSSSPAVQAQGVTSSRATINQQFNQMRVVLSRLRPGDPRALALSARMTNLNPAAASIAVALAMRRVTSINAAKQLLSIITLRISYSPNRFRFGPLERSLSAAAAAAIANAIANSRIVATADNSTSKVANELTGDFVTAIELAASDPATGVSTEVANNVLVTVLDEFTGEGGVPAPTPTPTPVPYGA